MSATKPVRMYEETETIIDELKKRHDDKNKDSPHLKLSKPALIHKVFLDELLRSEGAV